MTIICSQVTVVDNSIFTSLRGAPAERRFTKRITRKYGALFGCVPLQQTDIAVKFDSYVPYDKFCNMYPSAIIFSISMK